MAEPQAEGHKAEAEVDVDGYKAEIRRTFALVEPISVQAAGIFYPTLWEVDTSTKPLFKDTDMDKQGEKLMKTLGVAVAMLNKMDTLKPILENLGRKHVDYGVTPEMYPSVGKALLITFEKGLGEECTPLTTKAWAWVFGIISSICIAAASEVKPEEKPEEKLEEKLEEKSEEKPEEKPEEK